MNVFELNDRIIEMQNEISSKIQDLNSGGCAKFAYYFSNALREIGISCEIYFCEDEDIIPNSINKFDGAPHLVVKLNDIGYIDGYKTFTKRKILDEYGGLRKAKINIGKVINNKSYWNPTYDTSQDSKLRTIIKRHLHGNRR